MHFPIKSGATELLSLFRDDSSRPANNIRASCSRSLGGIDIDEKIMTRHPDGKAGVNIDKSKYDQIHQAVIESLKQEGELTFSELRDDVHLKLEAKFEGSISWYYTTVKLDLEARGDIERIGTSSPQMIRLTP